MVLKKINFPETECASGHISVSMPLKPKMIIIVFSGKIRGIKCFQLTDGVVQKYFLFYS